jgi:hypothetical protein
VLQRALERGNELFRDLQKSRTPSGAINQIAGADADQLRLIALDRILTAGPEGEDGGVESTEAYAESRLVVFATAWAAAEAGGDQMAIRQEWET